MILVTLCCATYVRLRCSTNPPLPISKGNILGRCLPEQPKAAHRRGSNRLYFFNLVITQVEGCQTLYFLF
jgi:hypothetical protein